MTDKCDKWDFDPKNRKNLSPALGRAKERKMASEKAISEGVRVWLESDPSMTNEYVIARILDAAAAVDGDPIDVATVTAYECGFEAGKEEAAVDGDEIRKKALMEAAEKAFAEADKFHQAMFDMRDDGAPLCAREYQEAGDALRDLGGVLKALCENDRREDEGVHPAVDGDAQWNAALDDCLKVVFSFEDECETNRLSFAQARNHESAQMALFERNILRRALAAIRSLKRLK